MPSRRVQALAIRPSSGLTRNTIEAGGPTTDIIPPTEAHMPNLAHTKAAEHHETAAKSHRAAASEHGRNDHMKGTEHSTEAHKHSKAAGEASDQAHAKSTSKK
jgi:hypothetical protein